MSPDLLARALEEFLSEARTGVVLEDDQIIFDLGMAHYSISADRGRCLLHLWSEERNIVRQVVEAEAKNGSLILSVQRFGQNRPHKLELCRDRDRRSQSARTAVRKSYARLLEHMLRREFPDWKLDRLSTTMDLERSFSPVYARGLLRKGRSALAVLGANQQETQGSIDAALTFGLLWLDHCREREAGQSVVEGVKLFVPQESSATLRIRMAQLNHSAAKFQLYELDERDESLTEIDCADTGNINTRLVRCPDHEQTRARFQKAIARVLAEVPDVEVAALSPAEISFRLHGLEFAKARLTNVPGSFEVTEEFVFGIGGYQAPLRDNNDEMFRQFTTTIRESRTLNGNRHDPLWRMYPERWLESLVFGNVTGIDGRLDPAHVYSQVPAFSASDRAMIDVLARTRDGRLGVIELKADEDIHLPMQGLDYWARVKWHHQRGEFQAHGYFGGVELSSKPPLLMMVAPALRVHPSIDTVLRYFSPEIEWTLIGVDERWREGVKVVFRKGKRHE